LVKAKRKQNGRGTCNWLKQSVYNTKEVRIIGQSKA